MELKDEGSPGITQTFVFDGRGLESTFIIMPMRL